MRNITGRLLTQVNGSQAPVLSFLLLLVVTATAAALGATATNQSVQIVSVKPGSLAGHAMAPVKDAPPYFKVVGTTTARYVEVPAYTSVDKNFEVSVKNYEQVTLSLVDWPVDEFMYLLDGRVEIIDKAGVSKVYAAGDSLVLPKGFTGTWKELTGVKMITAIYEPKPRG